MGGPVPNPFGGNKRKPAPAPKAEEQPKVKSQMDAPKPITPKGPTSMELAEQDSLERKKRGRAATILTSITGDTPEAQIVKKTLLGG